MNLVYSIHETNNQGFLYRSIRHHKQRTLKYIGRTLYHCECKEKEIFIYEGEEVNVAYFFNRGFGFTFKNKNNNRKIIVCIFKRGWVALSGTKLEKEIIKSSVYCTEDSQFIGIPIPIAQ